MAAATTIRLQQPIPSSLFAVNFKRNPHLVPSHYRFCHACKIPPLKLNCTKPSNHKCCFAIHNPKVSVNHNIDQNDNILEEEKKPVEKGLVKIILEALIALQKPAATVAFLAGLWLCLVHDPNSALAASGGRMGGASFSSSRSSSRSSSSSSSSRSYSSSSSRSSSGSYSSYSSGPSYSSDSSSPSYTFSVSSSRSTPAYVSLKAFKDSFLDFLCIALLCSVCIWFLWHFWCACHEQMNGFSTPNSGISVLKVQACFFIGKIIDCY